jgi:hypothetical protein
MNIQFVKIGFLAALTLTAVGCGTNYASGPFKSSGGTGRVRFVNLVTDPTRVPVNAILESASFGVNLDYTATAPATANYSAILTGNRSLVLTKSADASVTVATIGFAIGTDEDRTVYATGGTGGAAVTSFVTTDANPIPSSAQVVLRIVNMSPSGGALDYFVTAPNSDLSAETPTAANVAYQGFSSYTVLSPGTYQVRAVPVGTLPAARATRVSVTINDLALAGGTGRTIVTADKAAGGIPSIAFVLTDQ